MLTKIVLYAHNFFCHKFLNMNNNNNNNGWGNPWDYRDPRDPRPYRGPRAFGGPQPPLPVEEDEPDLLEEPLPELRPMGWGLPPDRQTWYWHHPRFPPLPPPPPPPPNPWRNWRRPDHWPAEEPEVEEPEVEKPEVEEPPQVEEPVEVPPPPC